MAMKSIGAGAIAAGMMLACGMAAANDSGGYDATSEFHLGAPGMLAPDEAPKPDPESWLDGWAGGVELGLNGSDGNSESVNFRAGANATRDTSKYTTKATFAYAWARNATGITTNKANAGLRNDWKLGADSRWIVFAQGGVEFDDFQDWDLRLTAYAGVGYKVIKQDNMTLVLRAGAGIAKEIGGSRNEVIPEGLLGADYEWKIDDRQKFTANVDFYPRLDEFGDYRVVAKAAYEFLVDPKSKMSFKLGIEDRYQNPESGPGLKKNDIDYFALLVWSF